MKDSSRDLSARTRVRMTALGIPSGHDYDRDPQSGAGNCWCGHAEVAVPHFHGFTPGRVSPLRCVCGKPPNWHRHRTVV